MSTLLKHIDLYTDGACSSNPGPGGYGAILVYNGIEKELSAGFPETTNNRMELTAAIEGLSVLKERCEVNLYSDSRYLVDAIEKGWLSAWIKNGWRKADKQPVLNIDLWQRLCELLDKHDVKFNWVKGHTGHPMNERCDRLATSATETMKQQINN